MNDNFQYTFNQLSEKELESFFQSHSTQQFSSQFQNPAIASEYARKIKTLAHTIECRTYDGVLIAILAYYINNFEKYIYIPYICVDMLWCRKGIASQLFFHLEKKFSNKNYEYRLEVRPNNHAALTLYSRLGYKYAKEQNEKWLMRKTK